MAKRYGFFVLALAVIVGVMLSFNRAGSLDHHDHVTADPSVKAPRIASSASKDEPAPNPSPRLNTALPRSSHVPEALVAPRTAEDPEQGLRERPVDPSGRPRTRPISRTFKRPITGVVMPYTTQANRFRVNLSLNTNPDMPFGKPYDAASVAAFSETLRVWNGFFPVNVWRVRHGVHKKVGTVRMPFEAAKYMQVSLTSGGYGFRDGDLVVIENNPGITVHFGGSYQTSTTPFASVIDNVSNDATTVGFVPYEQQEAVCE